MRGFNARLIGLFFLFAISSCVSVDGRKSDPAAVASANLNLAKVYFSKGQYLVAEEKLDRALKSDPDNVAAHALLALVFDQQAKKQKARSQYETALELAEDDSAEFAEINNNFAIFLCKNGDWTDAEKHFLTALKVAEYKTPYAVLENAGLCAFNAGDYTKAGSYFQEALIINSQLTTSIIGLAKVKASESDWSAVKNLIQDYHGLSKPNDESLYYLMLAEHKLGNKEDAQHLVDQLGISFPDSPYLKKIELD